MYGRTVGWHVTDLLNVVGHPESIFGTNFVGPLSLKFTPYNLSSDYVISGSLSPRHGASSGCGWRNGLRYGGSIIPPAYGVNFDSRMLDKILYLGGKSDVPL